MKGYPLVLADANRAEQFALLGRSRRLFDNYTVHTDKEGIVWAATSVGTHVFATTWLGAGWAFDPGGQSRRGEELADKRLAMRDADAIRHQAELDSVIAGLRLGPTAERLLWKVHQQMLQLRTSLLCLPDFVLADAVWGDAKRPGHWRQEMLTVLKGLTWLHVAPGPLSDETELGAQSVLLTYVADLRGSSQDQCSSACPLQSDRPHHHILINVARGFLGVLEQFAQPDESGIRSYTFPLQARYRRQSATLRKAGKSGELVSVYLSAKLGSRDLCDNLSASQHRMLQAIVRETTRNTKESRESVSEAEVVKGNMIPTIDGKDAFACNLLSADSSYVGFNGNKLLKGRGYLLTSAGGWLAKAGYSVEQIRDFFDDLRFLSERLGLIPVGIEKDSPVCLDLPQLLALAGSARANRVHLRIFAPSDYLDRWNKAFGWESDDPMTSVVTQDDPALTITTAIKAGRVSQKELALGLDIDPSLLSKVLRGRKRWPAGWLDRAIAWLTSNLRTSTTQDS